MYRGYQDSRWVLDADGLLSRGRESAIGMALVDGQVVAGMRRAVAARTVTFEIRPLRPLESDEADAIQDAAARYAGVPRSRAAHRVEEVLSTESCCEAGGRIVVLLLRNCKGYAAPTTPAYGSGECADAHHHYAREIGDVMSTKVEKSILVNVPLSVAYNQWTQFEEFPQFMGGIKSVTQLDDQHLEWVAEIAGVRRQWKAKILEQVPDRKVSWAATEGATNAGSVTFEDVGGGQTQVHLVLEYEPEGLVEKVGDKLNVVENQAEGDLDRFKAFIESEGYATGAWRGSVGAGTGAGEPGHRCRRRFAG